MDGGTQNRLQNREDYAFRSALLKMHFYCLLSSIFVSILHLTNNAMPIFVYYESALWRPHYGKFLRFWWGLIEILFGF